MSTIEQHIIIVRCFINTAYHQCSENGIYRNYYSKLCTGTAKSGEVHSKTDKCNKKAHTPYSFIYRNLATQKEK